jgi:hypothetical protein
MDGGRAVQSRWNGRINIYLVDDGFRKCLTHGERDCEPKRAGYGFVW